ncbi:nuclear transport factor 2 family protein [Actinomadura sp. 9N407]|uniref:nuclear transport factor 2 family protein n=1 Tax=Actinomadura sp. 9N407 TaxID=3375154 RepID=UPI0037AD01E9
MNQRSRRLLAAASAAACAFAVAAGCGTDAGSTPNTHKTSNTGKPSASAPAAAPLLPPVAAYVSAVKNKDLDALAGAFAENAQLTDVGRRFDGRAAIRAWAQAEVIGGTLTVTEVAENRPGHQRLLVRFAPGGTGGFAAYYAFTVSGSAIARADLTYAD